MTPIDISVLVLAGAVLLILLRLPVAIALGLSAFAGAVALLPLPAAVSIMTRTPHEFAASWEYSAVPLFLAMGALIVRTGLSDSLFILASRAFARIPGGLAIATNFAGAAFGAASGSSLATTIALGRLATPRMLRAGYDPGLATAVTACSGTMAALIPPSIPLIVYGILAEQSVVRLFFAGILPGLLTALGYGVMIWIRSVRHPELAPPPARDTDEDLPISWSILALPMIAILVLGGIYGGWFSPGQAGAVGTLAVIALSALQPGVTWPRLREAFADTARQTASILFVAAGAMMLTRTMALTGLPAALASFVADAGLSPALLLAALSLLFLLLGMILDPFGIMMLAVAVLLPTLEQAGFNLIWMGIVIVKYIEIGVITPPVGMNVFAAKSIAPPSISLTVIFRGVSWFLVVEMVILVILLTSPELVLWLPDLMTSR
ncbi:TRAP transporter large permease [Tistrella mobilis]|uniref:TRAP transporter large permease protein n=1 Tax=Tistrella mobilis (strain KA081020-065) TaxID=1110502 RepID=I3TLK5_TISMK|nr:TRAP transporter large permease [Tistrella mobilis]AFK53643.1 TRAP-T family protein transporter, DctM (12 TMs) subunit [Tistrella mobilis KA081020-065]